VDYIPEPNLFQYEQGSSTKRIGDKTPAAPGRCDPALDISTVVMIVCVRLVLDCL
jgi:hypothetical protein